VKDKNIKTPRIFPLGLFTSHSKWH